jgi:transcriptional regulator with AAA-type ATPase domain
MKESTGNAGCLFFCNGADDMNQTRYKYVVTPGLNHKIREFEAHCKVAGRSPIMICGPSGAGKSLFLHIFKMLYREKFGSSRKITTINCSHFTGDLARSELFGHVKGAFTGSIQDKDGWIRKADGGALILEEIGELSNETQAKLLTFIEDGRFHRVGSAEIETADVQIVGATNDENKLREDFRYRFFPFYVPPLHRRRHDILYQLAHKFPELMHSLLPWELLTLLAYHWPGNVRELERVGLLLQRAKVLEEMTEYDLLEEAISFLEKEWKNSRSYEMMKALTMNGDLSFISDQATALRCNDFGQIHAELAKQSVDVKELELLLNRSGLSLSLRNRTRPFASFKSETIDCSLKIDERFKVAFFREIPQFQNACQGFQKFCTIFWQHHEENRNLLDIKNSPCIEDPALVAGSLELSKKELCIMEAILNWKKPKPVAEGRFPSQFGSLGLNELLKHYFGALLKETAGNQAKAARKAGVRYTTFRDQLKKYGIT